VTPDPHACDGSYTELELEWQDIHIRVQSSAEDNELYLVDSPIKTTPGDSLIIVPRMLWEREGDNQDVDGYHCWDSDPC
jgi:hypothetical protein